MSHENIGAVLCAVVGAMVRYVARTMVQFKVRLQVRWEVWTRPEVGRDNTNLN